MSISKYFATPAATDRQAMSAYKEPSSKTSGDSTTKPAPRGMKGKQDEDKLASLREEWRVLYAETLPAAARRKAPEQSKWPVTLDHCFGRIVLDNAVGKNKPWAEVVKSPAIRHMNEEQLQAAIDLGKQILAGEADLVELDERSLSLRGKKSKADKTATTSKKRSASSRPDTSETLAKKARVEIDLTSDAHDKTEDREELEALIDTSDKTDFQKRCLKALLQIPPGQFSTYAALSKFLQSSPRAVGNAMRGNPFAPRVPCHRILAADRSIGGFGGSWGVDGKHYQEKLSILKGEGVRFDSKGKVLGPVFTGYR